MSNNKKTISQIKEYLQSHFQFVLARYGEYPWVATLYYSVDDDLNIYFLTGPHTIHAEHIAKNSHVAAAISDAPQAPNSNKKGLQISGVCVEVTGARKITHAITLWTKTLGVTNPNYSYEGMVKKAISGHMYKLTPKKIKYFNEELWEEGKEKLIEL